MNATTCCFIGQGKLPADKIQRIIKRLDNEIEWLISQGVTRFLSSGDLGFAQIAASLILAKRQQGANIVLALVLPYRAYGENWEEAEKQLYHGLLSDADGVHYIGEVYGYDCIKRRNQYMLAHAAYCICTLFHNSGGVAQAVRHGRQMGVRIINIAK